MMFKIVITCSLFVFNSVLAESLFTENDFKISGPGLKPKLITMPARYFFIEPINENISCTEVQFDIEIKGVNERKQTCRIWTNVLKTRSCSHIVRYKLYEACESLTISIKYNNKHISESPYVTKSIVYAEECKCPTTNLNKWLVDWECGDVPEQINKDLSIFKKIDFNIVREKVISKYDNPGAISLCHYVVKNNEIYRKCYGKYVGFKMFMDSILLSLSRKIMLPDLEFFINLGDWPLVNERSDNFPIFSWCGSTDSYDILLPTYDITEATLENMGRVMLDMLSVQGNTKKSWEERIPKVMWRGRDSNRERLHLIDISREHPELFNVSLTNFFFFRAEEEKYGPKSEHISFFNFFDYKYQLSIDGTVAAYRLPYLLAGGSLLLKQESKYYEHFYNQLKPNIHYIPIKRDLSDLVEKVNWSKENDAEAELIAQAGKDFANKNLLPKNIFCYHVHLFNEFNKKIVSEIKVLEDMELVEDSKELACNCDDGTKDEL